MAFSQNNLGMLKAFEEALGFKGVSGGGGRVCACLLSSGACAAACKFGPRAAAAMLAALIN